MSVVALTLALMGPAVIIRLDSYFREQDVQNLGSRSQSTLTAVVLLANQSTNGILVTPDDHLTDDAQAFFSSGVLQKIADTLAFADVAIRVGTPTRDAAGNVTIVPAPGGAFTAHLAAPPGQGQARERIAAQPVIFANDLTLTPWAIEITLSNPYTLRASTVANVTGLFLAVGAVAFVVSVIVATVLARRFTTPLRRLTSAASDLERGELGSRVPTRLALTGATEISELSRQFNAMAERLEESVAIIRHDRDRSRDFLADVSHELRTPIAALRTFNELLNDVAGNDPDTRAEFLESSRQQLQRLDWLAQNLLDLSKLDSGLVLLDLRPDDLRSAVESAVEQAEPSALRRGITLSLVQPPHALRIRHDPPRIGQVVTNLVGNALKFTPRGGSVWVELRPVSEGAQIEVRDSGVGIDASELPRIFERFYRGSRANEARGSGSGLGLSIVKSIVDLHAGRVAVESRLGAGTTFIVTLPLDPRTELASGPELEDVADSSPSSHS